MEGFLGPLGSIGGFWGLLDPFGAILGPLLLLWTPSESLLSLTPGLPPYCGASSEVIMADL